MWRLLLIILLSSCASTNPKGTASDEDSSYGFRIVNIREVPLNPSSASNNGQPPAREFSQRDMRGGIQQTGAWNIYREVIHKRLRCATYETGIQLGKGSPACSHVKWLTNLDYGTRRTHCNSATLVHTGGGEFANMSDIFGASTCVRVVIRCEGAC